MDGNELKLLVSYAITAFSVLAAVISNTFRMGEKKGQKGNQLEQIKDRLTGVSERMDTTDRTLTETGNKFEKNLSAIDNVMKRMDEWHHSKVAFESSMLAKFSGLNERIDAILVVHADIYSRIGRLEAKYTISEELVRLRRDTD